MIPARTAGTALDLFVTAAAVPGQDTRLLLARWPQRRGDFFHCLEAAHALGVAPAFAENAAALAADGAIPELATREVVRACQEVRKEALFHFLRWERGSREVLDVWATLGLPAPLVLKGGGTKYTCYSSPWLRTSSDLDLLLPEEAIGEATAALTARGFKALEFVAGREWTNVSGYHVRLSYGDHPVELHRAPSHPQRGRLNWDLLRHDTQPLAQLHPAALAPDARHQFLVNAAHALKEGMLFPLRDLVDLHLLLREGQTTPGEVLPLLRDHGLARVAWYLAMVCRRLFGLEAVDSDWPGAGFSAMTALPAALLLSPVRAGFLGPPLHRDSGTRKLVAYLLWTPGMRWTAGLVMDFARRRAMDLALAGNWRLRGPDSPTE